MLQRPTEEYHVLSIREDFQEEKCLQEESGFLVGRGLDQVIGQCSMI